MSPLRRNRPHARDDGAPTADMRMRVYSVGVLLGLTVLGGRLVQLQGADAGALAERALRQRTSETKLYAKRGDVVDAKGVVLATSVERRDVIADPQTVQAYNTRPGDGSKYQEEHGQGPAGAAARLAPVLGIDEATLTDKLTVKATSPRYAVVAVGITPELWQQVADVGISGITSKRQTQRIYPTGSASSTLVGVLGTPVYDEEAKAYHDYPLGGLESAEDDLLTGTDGSMKYERSLGGQEIPLGDSEMVEPVDGTSLHLTIDSDLQWKAQSAIAAKVAETGAKSGTVVIMDRRQRLLALASAPSIDPTNLTDFTNDQLLNTALTEAFEPGSTAKVVTLAAVLEEGKATASSPFTVPYALQRSDKLFHDSHEHPEEKLTLAGILAQSSNTGTILAGEQLDARTLYDYQRAFGFGSRTTLSFPGETAGIVAKPEDYSGTQRYTVMFGQGLSVNAVQAASVFATIANDGVRVEPTLIAGTSDPNGNRTTAPAGDSARVVSSETAKTLRDMMQAVVSEEGTAAAAEIPGYLVAGKTGTAERYDEDLGRYSGYTASFIGLAPADDPELVVAVILQDPRTNYYGGSAAGPVFKEVMTYALAQRGVAPSAEPPANLPLTWGGEAEAGAARAPGAAGDAAGAQ
ncbi:cell division protein FtsI (penicillin-binding protein 3) [Kineococcus radiotolerans]|uniref:Cell division protein FtsI (Penicillin-binding protein 3) n=1 Tax=Kineococcus radiotolerans TaxID=131568 RepID=A0A7W4TNH0_KINRA|nr:penicillin-binding protein 2 [Kineococcus radiotolerans]MBB2901511.1 cell division protein FtsI (penicillin-binding protein 3) [Kineococcus radiotolerans]